jgi:hemerythrin
MEASMDLKWSEKYSVNNEIIDIQHKMLFTIVNELNQQIINGDAFEALEETLEKMSIYATMHFRTEEDLLFKSDYQEYIHHKALHEAFKKKIIEATQDLLQGHEMSTVISIHKFLQSWLTDHILVEDAKYYNHIV